MTHTGYDPRKLRKRFDSYLARATPRLVRTYGQEAAAQIAARARAEFRALAPRIPYIGGRRNAFTEIMVLNGGIVALHRAMTASGHTVEEVVRICYQASDDFFQSLPSVVDAAIGAIATSRPGTAYLERQAARSQDRRPEDFVYTCTVRRQDGAVELELELLECAVQKYYDAEGVPELKPFCNFFDPIYSTYFGLGVTAEHTLGLGCETCKLNFNNRRQTMIPANIRAVLNS